MAFSGYLLKVGSTQVPMQNILLGSYNVTPDQRMDNSSERDTTGILHRDVVDHTATKIEFNTPPISSTDLAALNKIFHDAFSNDLERKLELEYYNPDTDSYETGEFYMPDIQYIIHRADSNVLWYDSLRFAFIEY